MSVHTFECGCQIIDGVVDPKRINVNCSRVWELLGKGLTYGVFQLESPLGKQWVKRLKPENMENLGALGSILRPGSLHALDEDGISVTEHYARRKNKLEKATPIDPSLEDVLNKTYGLAIYQENAMAIAIKIAGFTPQEADILRKSIGKKKADLLASLRTKFIEGCKKVGLVTEEKAVAIFDMIEKSNRYSFNKCIWEYQLIQMLSGPDKYIKDIQVGDWVTAPNSSGGILPVKVLSVIKSGVKPVWHLQLTLNSYNEKRFNIYCTRLHKLLCTDGKLRTVNQILESEYNVVTKYGSAKITVLHYFQDAETYDLEVDSKEHVFYAGDIVVSNSHAIDYGNRGYICAWIKAHDPLSFYCGWLRHATDKQGAAQEEMANLIEEAKLLNVEIKPPNILNISETFHVVGNHINCGCGNIKGIGDAQLENLREFSASTPFKTLSWYEFLINHSDKINKTVFTNLTKCGAFDDCGFGVSRSRMLYEYDVFSKLTDGELKFVRNHQFSSLTEALRAASPTKKQGGAAHTASRSKILNDLVEIVAKPLYNVDVDTDAWRAMQETELLGIPLTKCLNDYGDSSLVDSTCKDFYDDKVSRGCIGIQIRSARSFKVKNGKNAGRDMAVITVADESCTLESIFIFSDLYELCKHHLYEGNRVILKLERGNRDDCFVVKQLWACS